MALKKKPNASEAAAQRSDRASGALLGLAVGDALGAPLQDRKLQAPELPTLATGPHVEMKGLTTDDTQIACALAWSLRQVGSYDPADALKRYGAWLQHAKDAGRQTRAALEAANPHPVPHEQRLLAEWVAGGKQAAGNCSLMRTAPIGVFFADAPEPRRKASLEDSALTHIDPRCQLACLSFNAAIAHAISSAKPTASSMADAARSDLATGAALLGQQMASYVRDVQDAVRVLSEDLEAAAQPNPRLYEPELSLLRHAGFVRVAFRLAFWELLHAPSLEAAVLDAVNRGGDADTHGAIVGALVGALHGGATIPPAWKDAVLGQHSGQTGNPFWETYHPRHLIGLQPPAARLGT